MRWTPLKRAALPATSAGPVARRPGVCPLNGAVAQPLQLSPTPRWYALDFHSMPERSKRFQRQANLDPQYQITIPNAYQLQPRPAARAAHFKPLYRN